MRFSFRTRLGRLESDRRTVGASGHLARPMGFEQLEGRWLLAGDTDDQISEAVGLKSYIKIDDGMTVPGAISPAGDVDMYAVWSSSPGVTIDFDIDTKENGPGGLDGYLRLFDSKGNLLAVSNNAANVDEYYSGYDAFIRYTFATSDHFYIGVSSASNINYNPITGAGDLSIGTAATGDYSLMVRSAGDWPDVGDVSGKADSFPYLPDNSTVRGRIEHDTDVDLYQVNVHNKRTVDFDVDTFAGEVGGLTPYMRLFRYNGQEIVTIKAGVAPGDTKVGSDPYLRHYFEEGGTYYVGISNVGHTKYNIMNRVGATPKGASAVGYYTLRVYELPKDHGDDYQWSEQKGFVTTAPIVLDRIVEVDLDVDMYNFTVVEGQTLDFDVDTQFNGIGSVDTYLRLFDGSQQLAANDNANATGEKLGFDAFLRYKFDRAGTYYIAVSNKHNIQYDPATGTGDTAGGLHSTGKFTLSIQQTLTTPIDLDDTIQEALYHKTMDHTYPTDITGVIHQDVDVDMFYFDVPRAGQTGYIVVLHNSNLGFQMRLFEPNGTQLAHSSGNPYSAISNILRYRFEEAGRYYIGVSARNNIAYHPTTGTGDMQGDPMDVGGYKLSLGFVPIDTDDEIQEATPFPELTNDLWLLQGNLEIDVDVDMFRIDATAGQTVDIDFDTYMNGRELNTYLRLFNADGIELASNNDGLAPDDIWSYDTPEGTDSYLRYTFELAGAYYIGVSNSFNRTYDASDGSGDTAAGAKTAGSYNVYVRSITLVNNDPDDAVTEAVGLQEITHSPQMVSSRIDRNSDVDLYRFTVKAGQTVGFDIDTRLTSLFSYLRLFNASGNELASNRTTPAPGETLPGLDPYLQFTFAAAGTYYLGVSTYHNTSYDALTGADNPDRFGYSYGDYTLVVQAVGPPPAPSLTFDIDTNSIPEINGSATGTVTRVDSSLHDAIIFMIVASGNNSVNVPTAIAIPAGQASINFSIFAIHDTTQATRQALLMVSAPGMASVSKSIKVTDSDGPAHNGNLPPDINDDGYVTALDALLIINYLNATGGGPVTLETTPYLDVSADGHITPMDALLVIIRLNSLSSGEGEAALGYASEHVTSAERSLGEVEDEAFSQAYWRELRYRSHKNSNKTL